MVIVVVIVMMDRLLMVLRRLDHGGGAVATANGQHGGGGEEDTCQARESDHLWFPRSYAAFGFDAGIPCRLACWDFSGLGFVGVRGM
ncbi:MAG: hypothetical protein ACRD3N_06165 [Terracidiphilus sp.]